MQDICVPICTANVGDVSSLIICIQAPTLNRIVELGGCTYTLIAVNNVLSGADGLQLIATSITIENGTIARIPLSAAF